MFSISVLFYNLTADKIILFFLFKSNKKALLVLELIFIKYTVSKHSSIQFWLTPFTLC